MFSVREKIITQKYGNSVAQIVTCLDNLPKRLLGNAVTSSNTNTEKVFLSLRFFLFSILYSITLQKGYFIYTPSCSGYLLSTFLPLPKKDLLSSYTEFSKRKILTSQKSNQYCNWKHFSPLRIRRRFPLISSTKLFYNASKIVSNHRRIALAQWTCMTQFPWVVEPKTSGYYVHVPPEETFIHSDRICRLVVTGVRCSLENAPRLWDQSRLVNGGHGEHGDSFIITLRLSNRFLLEISINVSIIFSN